MRHFSSVVVRNSVFGIAAQLAIKVLSFAFSVLIVRNLGAATYGQYTGVLAFGALFIFIADLGLSPFTVREVARLRDAADGMERSRQLFSDVLVLRMLLSLLASGLVIGTALLTGRPSVMVIAIALGNIGLLLYSLQGTSDSFLAGFERLDLSAGSKVSYQLVFVLVGSLMLWMEFGYYGLIFANLLGIALMTYVCWRGVRALGMRFARPKPGNWFMLLRASIPFGVVGFTLGLSYKFDSVLLNIFRSDVETGYYNAAYSLVFSTAVLSNAINTALYPSLARQAASMSHNLSSIYSRALRYLMVLSFPIAVGASALADQIVLFLFGLAYGPAALALKIVIWVVPLMFISEFLGYVVVVSGREGRVARAVLLSTGLNVVINILLVPRFGLLAAAAMTVVTEAVLVGQYLWMLREEMRQLDRAYLLWRPVLAALLMGGLVLLLRPYVPFFVNVGIGGAAYVSLLLVFGVVGIEELRFIRNMRTPAEAPTTY
jgi:O-antigen/teichoic acid export membrane protein